MNLHEYQKRAIETESVIDEVIADKNELLHVLAIFATAGEMLDCLKKKIYYKNPKKYDEKFQELSDSLKFFDSCADRHHCEQKEEVLDVNPRVFHGKIGMMTEAAELGTALMKYITTGELDAVNVQEEMGDSDWYRAIIHDALDLDPEKTLDINIKKLQDKQKGRYKAKVFNAQEAEVRDLDAERAILEGKH